MKKILSAMVLCCGMHLVHAQSTSKIQANIEDKDHKMIAYVYANGTIFNKDNTPACHIYNNGTVTGGDNKPMAYLTTEGVIENADHKAIGYFDKLNFQDANHKTLVAINPNGDVVNGSNTVIGYESNTEPAWVGLYFYFFNK